MADSFRPTTTSRLEMDVPPLEDICLDEPTEYLERSQGRPGCFKNALHEILFVVFCTLAGATFPFLQRSTVVVTDSIRKDLGMTQSQVSWISASSGYGLIRIARPLWAVNDVNDVLQTDHRRISSAVCLCRGELSEYFSQTGPLGQSPPLLFRCGTRCDLGGWRLSRLHAGHGWRSLCGAYSEFCVSSEHCLSGFVITEENSFRRISFRGESSRDFAGGSWVRHRDGEVRMESYLLSHREYFHPVLVLGPGCSPRRSSPSPDRKLRDENPRGEKPRTEAF